MTTSIKRSLPGFEDVLAQRTPAHRALAEVALDELRALRDVDAVAPPEAAALVESLSAQFSARPAAADRLRLPQLTHHDGATVRAALTRVLAADTRAPSADRDAVIKDERMRRALRAIDGAMRLVRDQLEIAV